MTSPVVAALGQLVTVARSTVSNEPLRNYAALLRQTALGTIDAAPPEVDGQMRGQHWSAALMAAVAEVLEAVADEREQA
jgi:hypothetical protein